MRIKKVKEISLLKSKIIKVFNFSKIHFKIKEIYIVKIKGIQTRNWRQYNNCKNTICTSGMFKIEILQKKKILKKSLKVDNYDTKKNNL